MRTRFGQLFVALLLIVGVATIYVFRSSTPIESKQGTDSSLSRAALPSTVAQQVASNAPQVVAPSKISATAKMRMKFESASNYAAFIQDAMQRPQEGGRFYALIAYHRCGDVANVGAEANANTKINGKSELRDKALQVVTDIKQRCSGVRAQYQDEFSFMKALQSENSKGTPDALLIERGPLTPMKEGTSTEDIARAKATGDPYLIAATLDINVDSFAEAIDPAYVQGRNRPTLYMAMAAATCEILENCRNNLQVLIPCLAGGQCEYDDYRDFLRANLPLESRTLFDKSKFAILKMAGH